MGRISHAPFLRGCVVALWAIAAYGVLAVGAFEQPRPFPDSNVPGITVVPKSSRLIGTTETANARIQERFQTTLSTIDLKEWMAGQALAASFAYDRNEMLSPCSSTPRDSACYPMHDLGYPPGKFEKRTDSLVVMREFLPVSYWTDGGRKSDR